MKHSRIRKFLIYVSVLIILISVFVYKYNSTKSYIFSEVTQFLDQKIHSVRVDRTKENVNHVLKKYKNAKFKKYSGNMGNTRRSKMEFYDKDGKLLFEMTDCGNSLNVVSISINKNTRMYQYKKGVKNEHRNDQIYVKTSESISNGREKAVGS